MRAALRWRPARWVRAVLIAAVLAGVVAMHGLGDHEAMPEMGAYAHAAAGGGSMAAYAVPSRAMPSHAMPAEMAGHTGPGHQMPTEAMTSTGPRAAAPAAPKHGLPMVMCLALLGCCVLALMLARLGRRDGPPATAPSQSDGVRATARSPDPPDLTFLSVCRC